MKQQSSTGWTVKPSVDIAMLPFGSGSEIQGKRKKGAKGKKAEDKGKDDKERRGPKPVGHVGTAAKAVNASSGI